MKKVAVMQPYFFPYLGYFSLIKHTDEFILLDTVQYIRHGWIDRNRVLKQSGGWLYIKVPIVKYPHESPIKDIKIDNSQNWKSKIISQLQTYKKIAPYYYKVNEMISNIFDENYVDLVALNKASLKATCEYLGIKVSLDVFSEMDLSIERPKLPDEWGLNICKALGGVSEYWNPPGGQEFFDTDKYKESKIELKFLNLKLDQYDQKRKSFEPGLSIIDVMMFNSPEEINTMLDKFELI